MKTATKDAHDGSKMQGRRWKWHVYPRVYVIAPVKPLWVDAVQEHKLELADMMDEGKALIASVFYKARVNAGLEEPDVRKYLDLLKPTMVAN